MKLLTAHIPRAKNQVQDVQQHHQHLDICLPQSNGNLNILQDLIPYSTRIIIKGVRETIQ